MTRRGFRPKGGWQPHRFNKTTGQPIVSQSRPLCPDCDTPIDHTAQRIKVEGWNVHLGCWERRQAGLARLPAVGG